MTPATRSFNWISSVEGDSEALNALHEAMMEFYSEADQRAEYQEMLGSIDEEPEGESSTVRLARYISNAKPTCVLEVGCGDGRLYRTLRRCGYKGEYRGVEVADHVIEQDRRQHSDAEWSVGDAYNLPVADESMGIVCAEFVLEHLVYPARGLEEMMRSVMPGGKLLLTFPDFVCSGRFASQVLGFSPNSTAKERLRNGRLLDGLVSLYDSRVRLPSALSEVRKEVGPFPVNLRPKCLTYRKVTSHDIDAVYIASKKEVKKWAYSKDYEVQFPWGKEGGVHETAYMSIQKGG